MCVDYLQFSSEDDEEQVWSGLMWRDVINDVIHAPPTLSYFILSLLISYLLCLLHSSCLSSLPRIVCVFVFSSLSSFFLFLVLYLLLLFVSLFLFLIFYLLLLFSLFFLYFSYPSSAPPPLLFPFFFLSFISFFFVSYPPMTHD